ncbi:MAG: glycosyltransferase family 39 protein, partial [Prolixibacteraceae bacterium]|nr:glycosyltransferase family 39 protein [Prolixibacteraceae bacterium]
MVEKIVNKRYFATILFAVSLLLLCANNQNISIYILDEAKNASCAREIMETSRLDYPTFNYQLRGDKPPLHYLFMILSYRIFGVNAWTARLFSAVFGALTILLIFLAVSKFADRKSAFMAALCLAASIYFQIQHHLAVPDPYLLFFTTWSILLFFSALETGKLSDTLLLYVALALGTLSKGPIALAIPGLSFVIYLIVTRRFNLKTIMSLKPLLGLLIFLALTLPWYVAVHVATNGEWTRMFFLKHNLSRFGREMEGHGGTFLLTWLYIILGMFPFSFFLVQSVKHYMATQKRLVLLSLIVSVVVTVVFSFSQTRLPNYTILLYPFFAVIIGDYLAAKVANYKYDKISFYIISAISVLIPVVGYIALKLDPGLSSLRNMSWLLTVLPAGAFISLWLFIKKRVVAARLSLAASSVAVTLVFLFIIYPSIDNMNPVKNSAHIIHNSDAVVYYHRFNPAYAFELEKEIPRIE